MPTSQDLILALRAQGASMAAIGRSVGRDSSLISQIAAGKKPGANLYGALDSLTKAPNPLDAIRYAAPVAAPRRVRASGVQARTRTPGRIATKAGATTATVKRTAAARGARAATSPALRDLKANQHAAVTITYSRAVVVTPGASQGAKTRSTPGAGGTVIARLDQGPAPTDRDDLIEALEAGDNLSDALAGMALARGWISGPDESGVVRATQSIELRTW